MTNFGSIFYDIEWVFGSFGNYFNTNILKGYYEANPPFDICLIKNMFDKMVLELDKAEDDIGITPSPSTAPRGKRIVTKICKTSI